VDGTKGTKDIFAAFSNVVRPAEEVILLHVEQLGGKSLMIDMLGEAEMATLRESVQGTEFKERLDEKAGKIIAHCRGQLEAIGSQNIRTLVREGVPATEILKVAADELVDLIILGYNNKAGLGRLISGSVTKDVERGARVPVLVAKNDGREAGSLAWREAYAAR